MYPNEGGLLPDDVFPLPLISPFFNDLDGARDNPANKSFPVDDIGKNMIDAKSSNESKTGQAVLLSQIQALSLYLSIYLPALQLSVI